MNEKEYKIKIKLAHRKKYGQFFTPETVAEIMVDWVFNGIDINELLEPAFGLGVFSKIALKKKKGIKIKCFEVDPVIFDIAKKNFTNHSQIEFLLKDYLMNDWENKYDAIVCNPPYFKFHDYDNKNAIDEIKKRLNIDLSGFTNIYTLFLLKSIYQLRENGRAAYIIPSEFLNSDYGKYVKEYLVKSGALRHIVTFDFKENIFDDAITTSSIFLFEKNTDKNSVNFYKIKNISEFKAFPNIKHTCYDVKNLDPSRKWRLYYKTQKNKKFKDLISFNNVAQVARGIATGANDYFSYNKTKSLKYQINDEYLLPCITKSKDVQSTFFTEADFEMLKNKDARIYLFNGAAKPKNDNVLKYIRYGEQLGIDKRYLTSKRTPWYSMEKRPPAPIWVGVFNRNGLKFVRNEAMIRNLTTFHCIYLKPNLYSELKTDLLFAYLLTDVAQDIFNDNRREYGNGLKKFEPNDLNRTYMLDVTKLDIDTENTIIDLYTKYRKSKIKNEPGPEYINEINDILIHFYAI